MRDIFREILSSLRRNKLRTCLTGFAVSWGIFMLIVLLGAGNGLMNSFLTDSGNFASNTMMVGGGWTSKPYDGMKAGRRIRLEDRDIDLTGGKAFEDVVDDVTSTVGLGVMVSYRDKSFNGYIEGNFPARQKMEKIELLTGRFINEKDIRECRKVVVLPSNCVSSLLGEAHSAEDLTGCVVKVSNIAFTVVGVFKTDEMRNDNLFYAPYTTVKTIYARGKYIDDLTFTFHGLKTEKENEEFEKRYKAVVNATHRAAPDDNSAIWIWNRFTQNLQMNKATGILNIALWIIGLFTLLGGIVGVSNIMLITVKERTHEFGIRKAIGASPAAINKLIITESVTITAIFGYVGMILGLLCCEWLDATVGHSTVELMGQQISMLKNPTVGVDVAVEATLVLIVAGTLAGFFPARKASKIKPIEALRAE